MSLETLIASAVRQGASDLHLEAGLPVTLRIRGQLQRGDEVPDGPALMQMARELIPRRAWSEFVERRSYDLSRTVAGARCRINVLQSSRGVGLAIRVLPTFTPTLKRLNLHPDLERLTRVQHGLVLISGATGSGKSSTLAAMLNEINQREARHIVTLERPIEFSLRSRQSFIRQREVGRDTPTFDQGLLDALREDPDVLMVGEMRRPETMRRTLDAAETGHTVFSTLHSATVSEAIERMVMAFPAEIRSGITAQLADCLTAIVCQRLVYREDLGIRVPELCILRATGPARAVIRSGQFFKLKNVLETGARDGQWTYDRYHRWLEERVDFYIPSSEDLEPAEDPAPVEIHEPPEAEAEPEPVAQQEEPEPPPRPRRERVSPDSSEDVIVLEPPSESISDILSELDDKK